MGLFGNKQVENLAREVKNLRLDFGVMEDGIRDIRKRLELMEGRQSTAVASIHEKVNHCFDAVAKSDDGLREAVKIMNELLIKQTNETHELVKDLSGVCTVLKSLLDEDDKEDVAKSEPKPMAEPVTHSPARVTVDYKRGRLILSKGVADMVRKEAALGYTCWTYATCDDADVVLIFSKKSGAKISKKTLSGTGRIVIYSRRLADLICDHSYKVTSHDENEHYIYLIREEK